MRQRIIRVRAEQGDAKAQYDLGASYAQGKGVPRDYTESVRWYRKAADDREASRRAVIGGTELSAGETIAALRWRRTSR